MGNREFIPQHGVYEDWNVYKLSLIILDITNYFANTYLRRTDRTIGQMEQAARSGKQNIVEGACAAATSRETEIKLTNVAKASLKEFHNLELWDKNDSRTLAVRRFAKIHDSSQIYIDKCRERSPETICNIAITLLHQLDYMLYCVIERAKERFLEQGGIREEMSRARRRRRGS